MEAKKSYLKLLCTNNRSFRFLVTIMFVIVLLVMWLYSIPADEPIISLLYVSLLFFVIIVFLLSNYINFLRLFIQQNKLINSRIPFNSGKCIVEIFQHSIKTTPLMKNDRISIETPPHKIECNFLLTPDFFVLFCKVTYFFGLFQREIHPILIKFDNTHNNSLGINKKRVVVVSDTQYEMDSLVITFSKNMNDIKMLKIFDFKKIVCPLYHK
jgi:hypothetical protein